MLFNFATKDDIKNVSSELHLINTRLEDRVSQLESDSKLLGCESIKQILKDQYDLVIRLTESRVQAAIQNHRAQYEPAIQLIEIKAQAAIQNLRAQYDLNMGVQDKNALCIQRLKDRISALENPEPKKKKPAVKAKE